MGEGQGEFRPKYGGAYAGYCMPLGYHAFMRVYGAKNHLPYQFYPSIGTPGLGLYPASPSNPPWDSYYLGVTRGHKRGEALGY